MKGCIVMFIWLLFIKYYWCGFFCCFDVFVNMRMIGGFDDGVKWLFEKLDGMLLIVWW